MGLNWKFWNRRKSPTQLIDYPSRVISYHNAVPVTFESAMQVSSFHRGVIYISTQVGKLPFEIKDSDKNIVENEVSYLLNVQPNPEMSALYFRALMIQSAILYGDAIAEIERDMSGRIVALWPITGRNFDIVRYGRDNRDIAYRVLAGDGVSSSRDIYLRPDEVFHIKNFHTTDGIRGQGLVAYAVETLGISLGADRMAGSLFANGGMPSGVLKVPGTLSEEALERLKSSWKSSYAGRKTGSTAILEEGVEFMPAAIPPNILQFLETRQFNVLEVARFLGIPPTKLFDIEGAKFANMENANLEVATDTLHVWAKAFELEADIKLISRKSSGLRSEIDLYEVFRGDMTTRAAYYSQLMQQGAITPNEIRQKEGMARYEGGDRYYIAVNNYSPADRVDEIIDSNMGNDNAAEMDAPQSDPGMTALEQEALKFLKSGR